MIKLVIFIIINSTRRHINKSTCNEIINFISRNCIIFQLFQIFSYIYCYEFVKCQDYQIYFDFCEMLSHLYLAFTNSQS